MPLTDPLALVVLLASFMAATFGAAMGFGSTFVFLAICTLVLPLELLVPIQGAFLLGALVLRAWVGRRHMVWRIVWPFSFGCFIGALIGARVYADLPAQLIATGIAATILITTWWPPLRMGLNIPHPFVLLGVAHTFLATLFSMGMLLQPVLLRSPLNRQQITATIAGAMLLMEIFKVIGYQSFGFDFRPWLTLMLLSWVLAIPGVWLGQTLLRRLSEERFRRLFKALLTFFAMSLLYRAWL